MVVIKHESASYISERGCPKRVDLCQFVAAAQNDQFWKPTFPDQVLVRPATDGWLTAAISKLNRWTLHVTVGTEDAAVTLPRFE